MFVFAALIAGVWPYARNFAWTGDPVFPFLTTWISPARVNTYTWNSYLGDTGAADHHGILQVLEFPFLAAADGHEPNVERCCAKILLAHGERMAEGSFVCPVCGTEWARTTQRLHGLRVPVFAKAGLPEPLTVQPGRTRPFLVALSEYSPPRD